MSSEITYGLVISPTARGQSPELEANPTASGRLLMQQNEEHIEAARPVFNTIWVEDHFQWDNKPTIESVTTLAYLAGRHEAMRFGNIVLGQSYRNPALTAKMAANLQMMTGGRFIMGIGAGWKEDEYRAYGYEYPSAGLRIEQLEEAVQIIRALWTQSPANFQGKHYHIENAYCA